MIWDSVWCSWWRSTDRRRTLDVHARAAAARPRRHLGLLSTPLLDRVLRFAGDRRHGLDQRMRHSWDRDGVLAEDDFLGPHDHVTLLQFAIGQPNPLDGDGIRMLRTPSRDEVRRVATALRIEPRRLGAVVRLVLLLADVRHHGVGAWNVAEAAHAHDAAAPDDDDHPLSYLTHVMLARAFALREDWKNPVAVSGGAAVAAYPALRRPTDLGVDVDPDGHHASMDWSPCRLRLELDLVLARKLARPDAFESLPRLVVALRGVQQVNDRVDLLEVEPDRTTAEVDDLLKQLDNYWKSSKDYYDDDEHCRGRNYFWDAPDLQCDY